MQKMYLSELEEVALLAVAKLGGGAYGVAVHQMVEENSGRETAISTLYAVLVRLERKGFLSTRRGESKRERGGRAIKYFKLEAPGYEALNEAQDIRLRLSDGVNLKTLAARTA